MYKCILVIAREPTRYAVRKFRAIRDVTSLQMTAISCTRHPGTAVRPGASARCATAGSVSRRVCEY